MRKQNWQEELWLALDDWRTKPFVWGQYDCVRFALSVSDSLLVEPRWLQLVESRYKWKDEETARAVLGTGGLMRVALSMEKEAGVPLSHHLCSAGDILLFEDDESRQALGVHDGTKCVAFNGLGDRLQRVPWKNVRYGWRNE